MKEIDLANVDRHPDASITSLIPDLSCRMCRPPSAGSSRMM
ncbi:MAG: hypothetical protein ACJ8EN_14610 [Xanthobacteraceae bacterium]